MVPCDRVVCRNDDIQHRRLLDCLCCIIQPRLLKCRGTISEDRPGSRECTQDVSCQVCHGEHLAMSTSRHPLRIMWVWVSSAGCTVRLHSNIHRAILWHMSKLAHVMATARV